VQQRSGSFLIVAAAAVVVGGYGAWVLRQGIEMAHWQSVCFGAAALVTALAMLARQPWSRFMVYALVSVFGISWIYVVVVAIRAGAWKEYDALRTFLSLVPGLGMLAVALICAFVAAKFLRPSSKQS
jgi:hypothetical protein